MGRNKGYELDLIFTSTNGLNWSRHALFQSMLLNGVAYGANNFVAVGVNGPHILSSVDGSTWGLRNPDIPSGATLIGAAYFKGTFLTVGYAGTILQSDPILAPPLHIARTGSTVSLSWLDGESDLLLESSDNLSSPSWLPASPPATTNQYSTSATGQSKYFRLRRQ